MSRLYASIDSDARKTQATSRGHRRISAHVRGWNDGVRVVARIEDDSDVFDVFATGGSSGHRPETLVGTLRGNYFDVAYVSLSAATCTKCGALICPALARLGSLTCIDHRPAPRPVNRCG